MSSIEENLGESRKTGQAFQWMEIVFKYQARFNKRVNEKQFWTHENHAVELSDNKMINSQTDYIHQNPVSAGWVENAEDYLYSSARDYCGKKGLIGYRLI